MRTASAFPDRERRHLLQFLFVPRLTYGTRFGLASLLLLAGLLVQLLWTGSAVLLVLFWSVPLLLLGNLLLLAKGYNLKPQGQRQLGDWEKSTREQFREVFELDKKVRSWDETAIDLTCKLGFLVFIVLAIVVLIVTGVLTNLGPAGRHFAPIFLADAAVLLIPHFVTGVRRGWRPTALREIVGSLEVAMHTIDRYEEPACQIQPMFQVEGEGDQQKPLDARVFIRFPDADESFFGLQFQVSLNEVQGTNYPYLYAVLVAKKEFGLGDHIAVARRAAHGMTVELGLESDVDVIVIRRPTT